MSMPDKNLIPFQSRNTGDDRTLNRVELCQFGRYEVGVELTTDGYFVGIVSISMPKDFRSTEQKLKSIKGWHDVEKYYEE